MCWLGITLALIASSGQATLRDWVRLSSGPPASEVRACLGYATTAFDVEPTPAGVVVARHSPREGQHEHVPMSPADVLLPQDANRRSLAFDDGWLVGFDAGEFGGGLWWVNTDGRRARILLGDVPTWANNVHALLSQPEGPLAFVGLTHLSAEYGAVFRCVRRNGRWKAILLARIEGTPTAATAEASGGALFVSTHGIGRVSQSGAIRTLLRRDFDGLYPSSIATDTGGTIYVGMRNVVIRLGSGAEHEDWLVPPGCVRHEVVDRRCVCLP